MKNKKIIKIGIAVFSLNFLVFAQERRSGNSSYNMFSKSEFIETEQPELNQETKQMISLYQKENSKENYLKLRELVIKNYDEVLERKEKKLSELKSETNGKPGGIAKVAEMEEIVQEMYVTYWNRINTTMLRFTDSRLLKWRIDSAWRYEYVPVMGAGNNIYVKRTPVTNEEYKQFILETKRKVPENWENEDYQNGQDKFPVNYVSLEDAKAYCEWLTKKDGKNTYRLPTESEWELAAGHMPKDAEFNCGIKNERTPVDEYEGKTRGAHGAIDFWGNVWEWTQTSRSDGIFAVKGGSYSSKRTDCRTEHRKESRKGFESYDDVGFRVIKVLNGKEPEQNIELTTLENPEVSATSTKNSITLFWNPVKNAVEYQIFEYFPKTDTVKMLKTVQENTTTINALEAKSTHSYIVQPISYTEIADNVSGKNSITITCKN